MGSNWHDRMLVEQFGLQASSTLPGLEAELSLRLNSLAHSALALSRVRLAGLLGLIQGLTQDGRGLQLANELSRNVPNQCRSHGLLEEPLGWICLLHFILRCEG